MQIEINEQRFQRAEIFIKVSCLHGLFSSLGHLPILSTVQKSDLIHAEGLQEAKRTSKAFGIHMRKHSHWETKVSLNAWPILPIVLLLNSVAKHKANKLL